MTNTHTGQLANGTHAENEQRRDYAKRTAREEVYKAIDGERDYQDNKIGHGPETISEHRDLIMLWARRLETEPAMKFDELVREIAAMCVRAMERLGPTSR